MIDSKLAFQIRKQIIDSLDRVKGGHDRFVFNGTTGHFNKFTDNDILWKNASGKFVGLDIRLHTKTKDSSISYQRDEEVASTTIALAQHFNNMLSQLCGVEVGTFEHCSDTRTDETYYKCANQHFNIIYHVKNDASGWGRPQVYFQIYR